MTVLLPVIAAQDTGAVADALHTRGACRLRGLPDAAQSADLREDLQRLQSIGALRAAAIGRGANMHEATAVRGDSTLWLDDPRCGDPAREFLGSLHILRVALNHRLFLGLDETEAHYALYPPGAGYRRHRDRFQDSDARVLSLVGYLNQDWTPADNGALRLHLPDGAVEVMPEAGTAVCFLSELEHEVLPATRVRMSIAAWMRRRQR